MNKLAHPTDLYADFGEEVASKLARLQAIHDDLFEYITFDIGKEISAEEREARGVTDDLLAENSSLTYGETPFSTLARCLYKIKLKYGGIPGCTPENPDKGGVFVDIGSGVGKPVYAAALLHQWTSCIGVELMEGLNDVAIDTLETWNKGMPYFPPLGTYPAGHPDSKKIHYKIPAEAREVHLDFICADATTEVDWSNSTVGFACSTCFDRDLMSKLAKLAEKMPSGSFFITSCETLDSPEWEIVDQEIQQMSWGPAVLFIHKRK